MKNKIAIASAFIAASSFSFAEIALTENISVEGFVDMSYSHSDADNGAQLKNPLTPLVSTKLKSTGYSASVMSLPKLILSMKKELMALMLSKPSLTTRSLTVM